VKAPGKLRNVVTKSRGSRFSAQGPRSGPAVGGKGRRAQSREARLPAFSGSRPVPRPERETSPRGRGVAGTRDGLPSVSLPASLAQSLSEGHPWVYRDHVPVGLDLPSGAWVHVRAGGFNGYGLWDQTSAIALRMFSRREAPNAAWIAARVQEAVQLRQALCGPDTTTYRLLYGEGDGLPGITVDVYGAFAVIATYADSVETLIPDVVRALQAALPLEGILQRSRAAEEGAARVQLIAGREPPDPLIVTEHGVRMLAELRTGQKTGLFLDHRENREFVRGLSRGRNVLNLFAYTGAFSVYAALGGAKHVTSVDISAGAIEAARRNFELNSLPASQHTALAQDVFEFLDGAARTGRTFDLIVCDPPSFAASAKKQFAALRAYTRLHALGLARVEPFGLYVAASCTAQVSPEAFRRVLAEAASKAQRRFQILHEIGQPFDHPVFAGHPEGRYLKFVLGRVLPLA